MSNKKEIKLPIETQLKLKNFKPRSYQWPLFEAIEDRGIKRAVLVWHRRCLSPSSHIIMSDGSFKELRDINTGDDILSWNGKSFEKDTVKHAWLTGIKETKVISSPNLSVISSQDHVFANTRSSSQTVNWDPIHYISPNRQLMQYSGSTTGAIKNIKLAQFWGYMLADGYVVGYQQPKFTNTNKVILNHVEEVTKSLFNIKVIWREKGNGFDLGFSNGTMGGGSIPNPIKELFRREGCDVPKSKRRLPKSIWQFDQQSLLHFFAALIAADGNIYSDTRSFKPKDSKKVVPPHVEITFSCGLSDTYAWDIYWLLRKIGIIPQNPYKEKGSNWRIKIGKQEYIKKLLQNRVYGKEDQQARALDLIKDYSRVRGIFKSCYSTIFKVKDGNPEELIDIETEKNHNFIANGFLVHNSGKDVTALNLIIRQALKTVGAYYYLLPTYRQARLVIFEGMTMSGKKFLDFIPEELINKINIQEMKITLINGSMIYFLGSDSVDSLRGSNPKGIVFSEYAFQHPNTYPTLRPILVANEGWCVFISTPFGENHFHKLYEVARQSDEWFCDMKTIEDTEVVTVEQIEKEEQEGLMSRDMIEQEYYCNFSIGALGSYYSKYLNRMELNNQIGDVPWEPAFPVFTAWDLGVRDSTAIIFFQVVGKTVHVIDSYSNDSVGLEHYVSVVLEKPYQFAKHFAPHDIMVREFGSGLTRLDKARELGIKFEIKADRDQRTSAIPNVSIMDGIEAVRSTLPRMWIDKPKCPALITAIRDYRREYDTKKKVYNNRPLHDSNSHFADCLRYLCLALSKCRRGTTPEDLDKRYKEAMLGSNANMPAIFRDDLPQY